jgi:hypothetical protein
MHIGLSGQPSAQRRPAFCFASPLLANEEDQSWPACRDCIFLPFASFQSLSRAKIDWNGKNIQPFDLR